MDFSWSTTQLAYKAKIISFAEANFSESFIKEDQEATFTRANWEKCAAFGLLGLSTTTAYGGATDKVDILTSTIAMEGLGYACKDNGLPFALNAQMWTVQYPILEFGSEAQKKKYLPKMCSGEWIGCHGLTEPNAGSDVFSMEMTATKVNGGYLLNGTKQHITMAPVADVFLIFAKTNPKLGAWGISVFIVDKNTKGLTIGKNRPKMGLRTVPFGNLTFKDCFIADTNRLGKEGAGWAITNSSLEYDRCTILAGQLGAMEKQLEDTIAFVKNRKQYNKPISQFQAISHRVADMRLRLETSRLLLQKVAWLKSEGKPATLESAMLKLQLSESFVASSLDAIRCNGGRGYITEHGVERDLRDAVGSIIYAGTSDIQKNIIAKLLGL